MNNAGWAKRVSDMADEAEASGNLSVAASLKSLAGSLCAGLDKEFAHHCVNFSRAVIEELERLETSRYN